VRAEALFLRAEHLVKPLGDGKKVVLPPHPRRDRHETAHARGLGTADHGIQLFLEVRKIEMAVAVDQHWRLRLCT
jgi:hypothetical protein